MATKMINIRIDEKAQEELNYFMQQGKSLTQTEIIRNAFKEYLSNNPVTWEDIDHELIPFLESFLKKCGILGGTKPSMPLSKIMDKYDETFLTDLNYNEDDKIDLGISLKVNEDDVLVQITIY